MISALTITFRGLRRNPAFTLCAIFTLALGIGANSTMFSIVNAVLLRPLPGYDTDRLVQICDNGRGGCTFLHPQLYLRLRERLQSFAPLAANQYCRMNLTGHGEPEQLTAPCATANWFELQRAEATLGRTFLPDEDQRGRNKVVVLDHGYWQRRFGADARIIGRTLLLDREPWTVVGVMPAEFQPIGSAPFPIYTPYVVADNPHGVNVTGRLKPGVPLKEAQAELDVLAKQLAGENPDWKDVKLTAAPMIEQITGQQRPLLLLLLGAVSFVLLIACGNVANLLLARCAARRHEMEIRVALGATRGHLVRFVLAESLAVSLVSCLLAVGIAYGGLHLLRPLTESLPRSGELNVDFRVLLCTLALGTAATLLAGLLPALRSAQPAQASGMHARTTSRSQRSLVASEVALAFVLLAGAGLLIQSFAALRSAELGYDPARVLTHFLALPVSADGSRATGAQQYERIRERVRALPGVLAVATASSLPMFGVSITMDVRAEGQPQRKNEHLASIAVTSEDYFRAMRIPLRGGRAFEGSDRDGAERVAIVSESIASRYFGGKALDRRIVLPELLYNIDGGKEVAVRIVGVVGDVCVNSVEDCHPEHIYLPERQSALRMENLLVRTAAAPMAMAGAVRKAIRQEAPALPLDDPQTLEERTAYLSDGPKRAMWLMGIFAALALVLAAAGIYGVSAYQATQRQAEIGIRMALGADFGAIAALVYRSLLLPSAAGLAIGLGAAAWLARLLRPLLYGVSAGDPKTLAVTGLALLAVSVVAATGPALRAALLDPARVLRRE